MSIQDQGDPDREEALVAFSQALSGALGFTGSPDRRLLERAAVDPMFLGRLIEERPADIADSALSQEAVRSGLPKWAPRPSASLLRSGAEALLKWGRAGFRPVGEAQAARRKAACLACDQLRPPGAPVIYRVVGAREGICGLCSCAVDKKVRIPTETCPAAHLDDPTLDRWGEPRSPAG
jgi:hypothetical protein